MKEDVSKILIDIWSIADMLRRDFKHSQFGRVILPFTLLMYLDCKQEQTFKNERVACATLSRIASASASVFASTDIIHQLNSYVDSFSGEVREIFECFNFRSLLSQLDDIRLLNEVVRRFSNLGMKCKAISNRDMGLIFEELIRRFAESSNETAGEHFTPRDIVRLTTSLIFMDDDEALTKPGIIRTIYDPTAGTGGFLSRGMEYLHELNSNATMRTFGQELNPESYAICKACTLIKGLDVSHIKRGNTLTEDKFPNMKFDFMFSHPPFGVSWKRYERQIKEEFHHYYSRFKPGLPRVSDSSLLFLMHMVSKFRDPQEGGSRIGIILNGSPLFTGDAGSGESEIRRYLIENDLLEAIVALPPDIYSNTGIASYLLILTNNKPAERKGKIQLINAINLCSKMRKSLGSKRNYLSEDDISLISKEYSNFSLCKALDPLIEQPITQIVNNDQMGYRKVAVERPLRLSAQITDKAIEGLKFRTKAKKIQQYVGTDKWDDFNQFTDKVKQALLGANIKLTTPELKQFNNAVSWINPKAAPVIEKEYKTTGNQTPCINKFSYKGKCVSFKPDKGLRDYERVSLAPGVEFSNHINEYFRNRVESENDYIWLDTQKRDNSDNSIGIVGYEIPFAKFFYNAKEAKCDGYNNTQVREFIRKDRHGQYGWDSIRHKLSLSSEGKSCVQKLSIDQGILNIEYFNFFLKTEAGRSWLESINSFMDTRRRVSLTRLLQNSVYLPSKDRQDQIVRLKEEHAALIENISSIGLSMIDNPDLVESQLAPYSDATQRYEDSFTHNLPQPLAALWLHAESQLNNKDSCQAYIKFYEYLGLFIMSIVTSQLDADKRNQILIGKNIPKSITMGTCPYVLSKVKEDYSDAVHLSLITLISDDVINLLKDMTAIRNDIAHRGLPSKKVVDDNLRKVENGNERLKQIMYDFFAEFTLLTPLDNRFDAGEYTYNVEILKGLALNPCGTGALMTDVPLSDSKLYFASIQEDDKTICHEIFPLMILDESVEESGLMAFYFYSDYQSEEDKLRYVCPLPNAETIKYKDKQILGCNIDDE